MELLSFFLSCVTWYYWRIERERERERERMKERERKKDQESEWHHRTNDRREQRIFFAFQTKRENEWRDDAKRERVVDWFILHWANFDPNPLSLHLLIKIHSFWNSQFGNKILLHCTQNVCLNISRLLCMHLKLFLKGMTRFEERERES